MEFLDKYLFEFILAFASTAIIAFLFKFVWKPKIEKNYELSVKKLLEISFQELNRIDQFKKDIFCYFESLDNFNPNEFSIYRFDDSCYDEIIYRRNLIEKSFNRILINQQNFNFLTVEQYIAVLQYILSFLGTINKTDDQKNDLSYDSKTLGFHVYYAKKIIEVFGENTDLGFKERWTSTMNALGGMENIMQPDLEPGDLVGPHLNLQNEVLYYDYRQSIIWNKLDEIHNLVKNNSKPDSLSD